MSRRREDNDLAAAPPLSRRETQIMDVLYRAGEASVADVLAALPDPPGYSSVRALLRVLEEKGHVTHAEDGKRYVYQPVRARQSAARSALRQVVRTFFAGSVAQTVASLISPAEADLSDEDLARLQTLIANTAAARRGAAPEELTKEPR